jgi:nucleotide-binding universal stress UspA family protein
MKTKKLLVGVDGSQHETDVIDAAIALAKPLGAQIHLIRAVSFPAHGVPYGMLSMSPAEVELEMLNAAEKDVEMLLQRVPPALRGGAQAVVGTPVPTIEKAAEDVDADLIVVGARGHGLIDRIVGSTASKVVNHANRSVLVVRAAQRLIPS